jgi:hypothetical protein
MSGTTTLTGFMRSHNTTRRLSSSIKLNGVAMGAIENMYLPDRPGAGSLGRSFLERTSRTRTTFAVKGKAPDSRFGAVWKPQRYIGYFRPDDF